MLEDGCRLWLAALLSVKAISKLSRCAPTYMQQLSCAATSMAQPNCTIYNATQRSGSAAVSAKQYSKLSACHPASAVLAAKKWSQQRMQLNTKHHYQAGHPYVDKHVAAGLPPVLRHAWPSACWVQQLRGWPSAHPACCLSWPSDWAEQHPRSPGAQGAGHLHGLCLEAGFHSSSSALCSSSSS